MKNSNQSRKEFISTFLERDIAGLGFGMSPVTVRRFWTMLAHYNSQTLNNTEIASSLGVASNTRSCIFRDTSLLHTLIGVETQQHLMRHPKLGTSWENFALEQVLRFLDLDEAY